MVECGSVVARLGLWVRGRNDEVERPMGCLKWIVSSRTRGGALAASGECSE